MAIQNDLSLLHMQNKSDDAPTQDVADASASWKAPLVLPQSETLFLSGSKSAPKNCYHEVIMTADFSAGSTSVAEQPEGAEHGSWTGVTKEDERPIAFLIHNILHPEENELLRMQMDDGADHRRPDGSLERHRQALSNRRQDRAELWSTHLADVLFSRIEQVLQQYGLDKYQITCSEEVVDNGRTLFIPETSDLESLLDASNEQVTAQFKTLASQKLLPQEAFSPCVQQAQPLSFPPQDVPMLFPTVSDTRDGKEGDYLLAGVSERFSFLKYRPSDPEAGRDKGDQFLAHIDQTVHLDDGRQSLFTILLYVSGEAGVQGGETNLLSRPAEATNQNSDARKDGYSVLASVKCNEGDSSEIGTLPLASQESRDGDKSSASGARRFEPQPGSALIFFQRGVLHEGCEVLSGTKTVVRSDVMYRKVPDAEQSTLDESDADLKQRWKKQKARAWKIYKEGARLEEQGQVEAATKLYSRAYKMDDRLQQC